VENPHNAAFTKKQLNPEKHCFMGLENVIYFLNLEDWHIYINAKKDRSITRFHVHFRKEKNER
jgi:hypothetical protein